MKVGQNADKKNVLEELLELGMVLVAIDARATGVDVPNHLGVDPQLRLNLSWRFGRPMEVDAWGINAELTFGGVPYGCKFPWDAIFLIVSHINGESYLFPDHVPKELLHQAAGEHVDASPPAAKVKAKRARPKLSLVPVAAADPEGTPDAALENLEAPGSQGEAKTATKAPRKPKAAAEPHKDDAAADVGTAAETSEADDAPKPPTQPARSRGHLRLIK